MVHPINKLVLFKRDYFPVSKTEKIFSIGRRISEIQPFYYGKITSSGGGHFASHTLEMAVKNTAPPTVCDVAHTVPITYTTNVSAYRFQLTIYASNEIKMPGLDLSQSQTYKKKKKKKVN